MFGIGGFELFIILIFGFLIFGPDKLPEIAKTVGRGIAKFREAQQEVNDAIGDEKLVDLSNPDEPFKDPVEVLDRIAQRHEEGKGAKAASTSGNAAKPAASAKGAAAASSASGATADSAENTTAGSSECEAGEAPRAESFTERKARYERERAARKAAEAEAAKNPEKAPEAEPAAEAEPASNDSVSTASVGGDE